MTTTTTSNSKIRRSEGKNFEDPLQIDITKIYVAKRLMSIAWLTDWWGWFLCVKNKFGGQLPQAPVATWAFRRRLLSNVNDAFWTWLVLFLRLPVTGVTRTVTPSTRRTVAVTYSPTNTSSTPLGKVFCCYFIVTVFACTLVFCTVSGKKRSQFSLHNFNKCRCSFVIFGMDHPEDSLYWENRKLVPNMITSLRSDDIIVTSSEMTLSRKRYDSILFRKLKRTVVIFCQATSEKYRETNSTTKVHLN